MTATGLAKLIGDVHVPYTMVVRINCARNWEVFEGVVTDDRKDNSSVGGRRLRPASFNNNTVAVTV